MIVPYDLLQTADRPVYLAGGNDGQVRKLLQLLGKPELIDDERFRTNQARIAHRDEFLAIVGEELRKRPAQEWCEQLWAVGVPVGPVNALPEVFGDPQVKHRQIVQELSHPGLSSGFVHTIKPAVTLHGAPATLRRHPPLKGEHTAEVLAELGLAPE
jgi:formyl-CoA transferase